MLLLLEDKTGVYRPPKLAPVVYDEHKGKKSKYEKDQERLRERSSRSRVIRDLMADMNDTPEEVDATGGVNEGMGYGERFDRQIQEKDEYEENNYVRLSVTRKEKQRMKAKNRFRFETEFDVRYFIFERHKIIYLSVCTVWHHIY